METLLTDDPMMLSKAVLDARAPSAGVGRSFNLGQASNSVSWRTPSEEVSESSRKLDMSLDDLIAQNTRDDKPHPRQQSYHYQYKGRNGPLGSGINHGPYSNRNVAYVPFSPAVGRQHPLVFPTPPFSRPMPNFQNGPLLAQPFPASRLADGFPSLRPVVFRAQPYSQVGLPILAGRKKEVSENSAALALALFDSELLYPAMVTGTQGQTIESPDDLLIIRFKGTDVLKVRKARGDMILNSGGWKTLSTRLVLNKALAPLGIWIEEVPTDEEASDPLKLNGTKTSSNQWRVVDSSASFLATFNDGMVIGNIGVARKQLLARASVIAQHWKQVKSNITRNSGAPQRLANGWAR